LVAKRERPAEKKSRKNGNLVAKNARITRPERSQPRKNGNLVAKKERRAEENAEKPKSGPQNPAAFFNLQSAIPNHPTRP
jgi:hypothetical protein